MEECGVNGFTMKKVDEGLTRSMLDLVVLGMLKTKSMHGYGIIQSIRKNFGIYFGPSTIYPFLKDLEKKGTIKSQWDMNHDRPRKVYSLTPEGDSFLIGAEQSLRTICNRLNSIGINAPSQTINKTEQPLTLNI
jgi:DNA-binding PadR family transcriptional regulator